MHAKPIDRTSNQAGFYQERQNFAAWVYLLVIAIVCISTGVMITAVRSESANAVSPEIVATSVILLLFLFNILALRTTVDGYAVRARLGRLIPFFWKRIEIASIQDVRVVTYRPLRDAGGWGMRFGRFEGVYTNYWNARGNRGVLIETEKRRYIIGSQDPEALHAAIEIARRRA